MHNMDVSRNIPNVINIARLLHECIVFRKNIKIEKKSISMQYNANL